MAAPESVYRYYSNLKISDGSTIQNIKVAKPLAVYTSSTVDVSQYNDILNKFKLSGLLWVLNPEIPSTSDLNDYDYGDTNRNGFIGYVKVDSSAAEYHDIRTDISIANADPSVNYYNTRSWSRASKLRLKNSTDNSTYIILNDAGLNTLASGEIIDLTSKDSSQLSPHIDDMRLYFSILGSYYNHFVMINVQYKLVGTEGWNEFSEGNYITNTNEEHNDTIINNILVNKGQYDFRLKISNEEGIKYSTIHRYLILGKKWNTKYDSSYASVANNNTNIIEIYTTTKEIETYKDGAGSIFYKDSYCQVMADQGYYIIENNWYHFAYNTLSNNIEVINKGQIGRWPSDDPAYNPPIIVSSVNISAHIDTSLSTSETYILNSGIFYINREIDDNEVVTGEIEFTINTEAGYTPYSYSESFSLEKGDIKIINLPNLPYDTKLTEKAKLTINAAAIKGGVSSTLTTTYALEDYT